MKRFVRKHARILYDAICDYSMDAILITAPDGRIFSANKAACDMFGMTEEEICSAGRNGLVDETDTRIPSLLAERERTGKAIGEFSMKRRNGEIFPCEVSSKIFEEKPGQKFTIMIIRDITGRKRALEELKQARDFADDLINTANVIFVQLDNSGTIVRINNIAEKILEYTREEITGKSWFDLIVPKSRFPEVPEEFTNVTRNRKIAGTFENPVITKSGIERQILWSNSTLIKEEKDSGTISFGIDITERRHNEDALKNAQFLLKTILSNAPITIFAIDNNGLFTLSDGKELESVGLKPGENVGISALDIYGDLPFTEPGGKIITGREVLSRALLGETMTVNNKLRDVVFENHIGPIKDNGNNISGAVGVAINITERVRAEMNIKEKEANLRSLVESSDSSIWSIDNNMRLIVGNKIFHRRILEGSGRKVSNGDNILEVLPRSIKKRWEGYYKKGLSGKYFTVQASTVRPLSKIYIRYHFNPIISKDGEILGLTVIGQNISDLKRTEENLRRTTREMRKLEVRREEIRENERTRIAHDLHDDLGQKVTGLNLDIAWIKSRLGVQTRMVREKLDDISKNITEIIENIREVSTILNPGMLLETGLVAAVGWHLARISKQTGIKYIFNHSPEEFSVDPSISLVIFRVIQEAVNNTVRHAKASSIKINLTSNKRIIELTVEDDGKGISQARTRSVSSMGIAGMKERIKSVNGQISITGKPHNGTRISVIIPQKEKHD